MDNKEKIYIEREIFKEIAGHINKPEITLITGSRQVGKTVLLRQLEKHLTDKKRVSATRILFYNLDLIQDWEIFQNQTDFIEFLKEESQKGKMYVFVDEAQKVPEAARFFKGVYDSRLNVKLILTGSSSLEIKAKLKETLTGRKMVFEVPPFTFFEFLLCQNKFLAEILKESKKTGNIHQKKLIELYKEYLTFGGYPRVVLAKTKKEKLNLLKEIYSSYVEKDAVGFLEIKNKTAFNRLVKLLAAQIGQLVNIEELAANLGIDRHTVERYILALEETFIVKKITPYFKNSRQEIVKAGKIYFLDLGIRNLALDNFDVLDVRLDKGSVLENAVFAELFFKTKYYGGTLHFWRTKQKTEVDFVIEKGLKLLPIEVKFTINKKLALAGLKNFIEKFRPKRALIVNLSVNQKSIKINKTKIDFVYPFWINLI